MYQEMLSRLNVTIETINTRTTQLDEISNKLQEKEQQLASAQLKLETSLKQYQDMQDKLSVVNQKVTDEWNRRKYMREQELTRRTNSEQTRIIASMETTMINTLAKYEERNISNYLKTITNSNTPT
jgi:hypothetical protein